MKKKIISMCVVAIIAVMAIASTSLAYLKDTDTEDNVFTVGNVKIDLWEEFEDLSELIPSTGKDAEGNVINAVEKAVYVYNEGKNDAYVRVHIAIPQILDDGDPSFDASKNVLHFNFSKESVTDGKWNWTTALGDEGAEGYGSGWNFYTTQIGEVEYNVYVVTYESVLTPDTSTLDAMNQVYLDSKVTNEDIDRINTALGENWHIYVAAEGVQEEGFADAYTALNTAFGIPGTYAVDWTAATGVDTDAGN